MENVAPTRMNLLSRRAQIKLASDGVVLLKGKREALLKELISRAKELRRLRQELQRRGRVAAAAVAMARAVRGTPEVNSAAMAGRRDLDVAVHAEKVWGLDLATIEQHDIVRQIDERGMGYIDCPSHITEAAEASEAMLEQLFRCAPLERNIQLLGEEVKKTSRRINALEEALLPRLRRDVRAIGRVLEEREREDTFRLKRIKKKKALQKRRGSQ
jgi:V/A-type H+-transporting ATPase subunit D